jgi:hypothetical protein
MSNLAAHAQALLEVASCTVMVAQVQGDYAMVADCVSLAKPMANLAADLHG